LRRLPLLTVRDLAGFAGIAALLPAAIFAGEGGWTSYCRLLGRVLVGLGVDASSRGRSVPPGLGADLAATNLEGMLLLLRKLRPGRWRPRVETAGREHLDEALESGRGAILLVHLFQPTLHLFAFPAAGYEVVRLSAETHGYFRQSRIGLDVLNPWLLKLESDGRIERIISRPGSIAHLRPLARRLARNRPVVFRSIGSGFSVETATTVTAPFLGAKLDLSTTPFSLALESSTPLLPAIPVAVGPGRFRLTIESPVAPPAEGLRAERVAAMVRETVRRLEPWVRAYPGQWTDWRRVVSAAVPTPHHA